MEEVYTFMSASGGFHVHKKRNGDYKLSMSEGKGDDDGFSLPKASMMIPEEVLHKTIPWWPT